MISTEKTSIHRASFRTSGFQVSGPVVRQVQLMVSLAEANTIHVSPEAYNYLKDTELADDIVCDPTNKEGHGTCVLSFSKG
jgi:hypothetical protein